MAATLDMVLKELSGVGVVCTRTDYEFSRKPRYFQKLTVCNLSLDDLHHPPEPLAFLRDPKATLPVQDGTLRSVGLSELFAYGLFPNEERQTETGVLLYALADRERTRSIDRMWYSRFDSETSPMRQRNVFEFLPQHCYLLMDKKSYDQVRDFCLENPLQINPLFERLSGAFFHEFYSHNIGGLSFEKLAQASSLPSLDFLRIYPSERDDQKRSQLVGRLLGRPAQNAEQGAEKAV